MIPDPDAEKPADWPEDEPEMIVDPEAEKPEDWDEEEDGEWVAPMIPNPEYRGEWRAPMIENPDYQGPWSPPLIPNPDFVDDDTIYQRKIGGLGIEIWQVEAGSVFNNFLVAVGDEAVEEAKQYAENNWRQYLESEREAREALETSEEVEVEDEDEHDL